MNLQVIKNARGFAAAASQSKKEESYFHPREPLKTTTLENVTVSSVETNKPISRLAVYFKYVSFRLPSLIFICCQFT
jgi:hypothetical protein